MQVKDKVVIVTGGGSGIGAASSKLFAQHGAKVVVSDINMESATATADAITAAGGEAIAMKTNVAKHEQIQEMVQQTVEKFGRLDVIVNNAGLGPKQMKKTGDYELDDWDIVIKVNQTGVFYGMKYALQQMMEQGGGVIVNIASLAGLKASVNNISYAASKFAVVGMTKAAALEYASKNIRINAVCPGYTESALLDRLLSARPDMETMLKAHIPMRRFGQPEEIAEAVVWLASDTTKFITGQTIVLDGGTQL